METHEQYDCLTLDYHEQKIVRYRNRVVRLVNFLEGKTLDYKLVAFIELKIHKTIKMLYQMELIQSVWYCKLVESWELKKSQYIQRYGRAISVKAEDLIITRDHVA